MDMTPAPLALPEEPGIVPYLARSLLALADDRGVSPQALCEGLDISAEALGDPSLRLGYPQVRALILRARTLLRDPALGLACGARQTPVSWGLAGLAMLTCETFGEAIEQGLTFQGQAGAVLQVRVALGGREAHLDVVPGFFDDEIEAFLVEETFAGSLAVSRCLVGPAFTPLRVDFSFAAPAQHEAYRRLFRCPVRFGAGRNRMSFESHWLGARLSGYDRITSPLVRSQLQNLMQRASPPAALDSTLATRLRAGIDGHSRPADVAGAAQLSERTLRRRLGAQQTSFRALRDDTRYARARELLQQSNLTMAQIAESVGYSDARAFRRAFKRWSGQLPAALRAAKPGPGPVA